MLVVACIVAGIVGAYAVIRQMEGQPGICPRCKARTLIPDQVGAHWRCVPCEAQYVRIGGYLEPLEQGRPTGDESVPTATLRIRDRDKVDE